VKTEHQEMDGGEGPAGMPEMRDGFIESEAAEQDERVGEGIRHSGIEIVSPSSIHDSQINVPLPVGRTGQGEGQGRESQGKGGGGVESLTDKLSGDVLNAFFGFQRESCVGGPCCWCWGIESKDRPNQILIVKNDRQWRPHERDCRRKGTRLEWRDQRT
jgi:hypothetical protein